MRIREYLDADWKRLQEEIGNPGAARPVTAFFSARFAPVVLLRIACGMHAKGYPRIGKLFALMDFLLFGIEFSTRADIGPGLIIPHTQGIVLGARSIGSNVTIYQQVTLGARDADFMFDLSTRPVVEDGVTLTAGAKVIGPVVVGSGSIIGANAVVITDIPAQVVAGGVPARVLKQIS